MGIIVILSMSYINTRIVKNIDKCGKNPQSAHRKTNYHTKCGKNCHKILYVYSVSIAFQTSPFFPATGSLPLCGVVTSVHQLMFCL